MEPNEETQPASDDPVREEQEGKGHGLDEGEREQALDDGSPSGES